MKILFYLFCFYFLSTFLLCQNCESNSPSDCLKNDCCLNSANNQCFSLEYSKTSYLDFKNKFKLKFPNNKTVIFEQIKCNSKSFECRQRFSNDIKENCFDAIDEKDKDKDHCCYMTLDFKYNKKHECYPANKNEVKKIIDDLEKEYYGIKSVKIKCDKSQYITFGFFLLFNILFLF